MNRFSIAFVLLAITFASSAPAGPAVIFSQQQEADNIISGIVATTAWPQLLRKADSLATSELITKKKDVKKRGSWEAGRNGFYLTFSSFRGYSYFRYEEIWTLWVSLDAMATLFQRDSKKEREKKWDLLKEK